MRSISSGTSAVFREAACATSPNTPSQDVVRLYEGAPLPRESVAVLNTNERLSLVLDGRSVPAGYGVELEPGRHEIAATAWLQARSEKEKQTVQKVATVPCAIGLLSIELFIFPGAPAAIACVAFIEVEDVVCENTWTMILDAGKAYDVIVDKSPDPPTIALVETDSKHVVFSAPCSQREPYSDFQQEPYSGRQQESIQDFSVNPVALEQYREYLWRAPGDPAGLPYLCRAADQGHPNAQIEVGRHFAQGNYGIQKDFRRAYVWYSLASNSGFDTHLKLLVQDMTPKQINDAKRMLADWKPGQCEEDLAPAIFSH